MNEQQLDENALVIPYSWRHYLPPRRGGVTASGIKADPEAERAVLDVLDRDDGVAALLLGEHGDPELAHLARQYRKGRPDPVGAAAVASVSPARVQWAYPDFWTAEHGIVFAACTVMEAVRMRTVEVLGRSHRYDGVIHHDAVHRGITAVFRAKHWDGVKRCRALLAAAADADHARAVERLAAHRGTPAERRAVSYLVPGRQDWVNECCDDPLRAGSGPAVLLERRLLFSSLERPEQLGTPAVLDGLALGPLDLSLLAAMVDGLGPGVLPFFLDRLADPRVGDAGRGSLFEAIAALPLDEAFAALLARDGDGERVRPALRAAMSRFPIRALRLLAEARSPLLNEHVAAHAALVAAVLPEMPVRVRAAIEPIMPPPVPVPLRPGARLLLGPMRERPPPQVVEGLRPPSPEAESSEAALEVVTALAMGSGLAAGTARATAAAQWLDRQGTAAVRLLVPAAFGDDPGSRRAAVHALAYLRCRYGLDATVQAATVHGERAAKAVETLLTGHPVETGLVRPPEAGDWLLDDDQPPVLWRGGERTLPPGAARRLAGLLALPPAFAMDALRQALDPETLAEFGWKLFKAWERPLWNQYSLTWTFRPPAEDGWALTGLAHIGDDETARRLVPVIRGWLKWRDERADERAITALDVLAGIGSEVALMHLHGIALNPGLKKLAAHAWQRLGEVARRRGLTAGQLDDRLVPDFGFDIDGGRLALDHGSRRFLVGFDDAFRPVVLEPDQNGAPRRNLPRRRAHDASGHASELASELASGAAFVKLKADLRTAATNQSRRLRRAMTAGRRWPAEEFGTFIVHQPVTGLLARRLLWVSEDGGETTTFRIAEDRTFADLSDDAIALPATARVGVAAPAHLNEDTREAWARIFLDYEIAQPFPQLHPKHVH